MNVCLAIIGSWSATLCVIGALITLASLQNGLATLPFLAMSGLAAGLCFKGMTSPNHKQLLFWPGALLCGLLFLPYLFAMSRWSGGESTAGWTWHAVLGFGSLLAALFSVVLAVGAIILAIKPGTRAEPGASPNGGPAERLGNSGVGGGPPSVS